MDLLPIGIEDSLSVFEDGLGGSDLRLETFRPTPSERDDPETRDGEVTKQGITKQGNVLLDGSASRR